MWLKSIWVNTCYLISLSPSCQWIQQEGGFDERFLLPSSSPLPLQVSLHCHTVIHCASIGLLRCFPRLAVAVWTMFACRASWQRCGPLARLSINRAHLYRDGEDRLICLVKFCLYLLVISFAVYLLCFGLSRSANFVISRISTLVYTENVFELICVIMYNCLARWHSLGLRGHEGQSEPIGTSLFSF